MNTTEEVSTAAPSVMSTASTQKRGRDQLTERKQQEDTSDDSEEGLARRTRARMSYRTASSNSFSTFNTEESDELAYESMVDKDGRVIKKAKRENDSCKALVQAFQGRTIMETLFSPDEVLNIVRDIIPKSERDIYTSWLTPAHRTTTLENVLESRSFLSTQKATNTDHYLKAVDKRREHTLGRNHTAPAIFWILMTSILYESQQLGSFMLPADSFARFEIHFPRLCLAAANYKRIRDFHLHLHRSFVFLEVLFELITVQGYLEICLLVVSCLEGRGKHHQRAGTNRTFPARAYRYLIEKVGGKDDIDADLAAEFDG